MRLRTIYFLLSVALFFAYCKKKKSTADEDPVATTTGSSTTTTGGPTPPAPGTQIVQVYDQDLPSNGYHDYAMFYFFYDSQYRLTMIKEYDTTSNASYVITKLNYKETTYSYNPAGKVDLETTKTFSPTVSYTYNHYYYDSQNRMIKKVIYNDATFGDSVKYTYFTNKILARYGVNGNNKDTLYLNNVTQNLDSTQYVTFGYTYKYVKDAAVNPLGDRDYALLAYGVNPYRCDHNIKRIKSPFGNFNFSYTYNTNNYPAFYTTILGSSAGCNVHFYYN
jgi:hypothetical protein